MIDKEEKTVYSKRMKAKDSQMNAEISGDRLSELLRGSGLRSTPLRRALLRVLMAADQPRSIEDLQRELARVVRSGQTQKKASIDVVTLYRNVKSFEDAGLVLKVEIGTGRSLYEFAGRPSKHRHHVICVDCEKIEYLDVCGLEPHLKILEGRGYRQLRHRLQFSGVCADCS